MFTLLGHKKDGFEYVCSKCQQLKSETEFHRKSTLKQKRPVTSWCKECRRTEDHDKSKFDTICLGCLKSRQLNSNGQCKKCNKSNGLRECRCCNTILVDLLWFYPKRNVCIPCYIGLQNKEQHGTFPPTNL